MMAYTSSEAMYHVFPASSFVIAMITASLAQKFKMKACSTWLMIASTNDFPFEDLTLGNVRTLGSILILQILSFVMSAHAFSKVKERIDS